MNLVKRCRGVIENSKGAALTEFAIVIPVVLMFFLAMLQFFLVVQASQLGNYAAYAAGRVYAVQESAVGADEARDMAETAAAEVFAPIARLMLGEVQVLGWDPPTGLTSLFGEILPNSPTKLVDGFIAAKYLRLQPDRLGGSVKISVTSDSGPKQVNVEINYPQPVFIPGLVELWNFVAGDRFFTSTKDLREGLEGLPQRYADYQVQREGLMELAEDLGIRITIPDPISGLIKFCPYINVRSKCSMGYSEWSGKLRWPNTVDSTAKTDPQLEEDAKDSQEAAQRYNESVKKERAACQDWSRARQELAAAQMEYDSATEDGKAAAQARLDRAKANEDRARSAYESARSNRLRDEGKVESYTGESLPDVQCP